MVPRESAPGSAPLRGAAGAALVGLTALAVMCAAPAAGCKKTEPADDTAGGKAGAGASKARTVTLAFAYGSEKKAWLKAAIAAFNADQKRRGGDGGVIVQVKGEAMGSGVAVTDIAAGAIQPHIWCPASDVYPPLLDQAWTAAKGAVGGKTSIAADAKPLVLSPVVIAMWKPMAEALGWPDKPIGWRDILALSADRKGWAGRGHPEWGLFKFGHTHPEFSNSGLLAVLAEAYAATGEVTGLSADRLEADATRKFLTEIESSVVHYGKSTGFFADKMLTRGPAYLSAAVVYENLVIDSYKRPEYASRPMDVVSIYPVEGTFWINNPLVILDAPWVTDDHKRAAAKFRDYLLSKPVQTQAMTEYGFRPTDPSIPVTAPISPAFGADPKQPKTLLTIPEPPVIEAALETWKQTKKTVDIVFVFDRSGSMKGNPLKQAKAGALDFLSRVDLRDRVSLLLFNHEIPDRLPQPVEVGKSYAQLEKTIEGTFADGGTALYDAIADAHRSLRAAARKDPKRIFALVVLTDGIDESSATRLPQLLADIAPPAERASGVRLFTIAYGPQADKAVLQQIAETGGGAFFSGKEETIRQVYRDLAAFF